jgi:hypothetical protein
MSIIEYLPIVLAGAGIALRFWLSRDVAQSATVARPAVPAAAGVTPPRPAAKPDAQRPDLALA